MPSSTKLYALINVFNVSGHLREFLLRSFAEHMLCDQSTVGHWQAGEPLATAEKATLADLVRFSGRELLGQRNGVPGFGKVTLGELEELLAMLGWRLKDDVAKAKRRST